MDLFKLAEQFHVSGTETLFFIGCWEFSRLKKNNKLGASLKLPIFIFISGSFCGGIVGAYFDTIKDRGTPSVKALGIGAIV